MRAAPKQRLVHARETVEANAPYRLVVVADTHGNPHPKTAELVSAQRPDRILHAGDMGDLEVLRMLEGIAPLTAIRGNIDTHAASLPDTVTLELRDGGDTLAKLLLVHIAVYGPKLRADAAKLARAEGASLVVCGHSHVPFIGRDRGLTVFNPGSCGPRRFHLPIVFGVLDVDRGRSAMRHVSCETGHDWSPPPM
jgi:putative phosphoesterase